MIRIQQQLDSGLPYIRISLMAVQSTVWKEAKKMNPQVIIMKTESQDLFTVAIANVDESLEAADLLEILGTYPIDLARSAAEREGVSRGIPVQDRTIAR